MIDNIIIKKAALIDAKELAQFGAESFCETFAHLYPEDDLNAFLSEKYSVEYVKEQISNDQIYCLIATNSEGKILGYSMGGPMGLPFAAAPNSYELYRLYVSQSAKGTGLAQRLYEEILKKAREIGAPEFYLGVWSQNERALKFYGRQGFEIVGQYYFPVGRTLDDERIMRLSSAIFLSE